MSHSRRRLNRHASAVRFVTPPPPAVRQRLVLSVDGELDVGCLVVLQQLRHSHGLVPTAQHALFDAGRVDVTDEALQRLQAAAEHRSVAQAGSRQPTTEVWVCAVGLEVGGERRVQLRLMMLREVVALMAVRVEVGVGEPHVSRPGRTCTRCQHLRGVTVAVGRGQDAVPQRSEVLSRGALALPSSRAGRRRPVGQLGGARQREAGLRRLAHPGLRCPMPLSTVTHTVHPQRHLLVWRMLLLDVVLVLPPRVVSFLQVAGFGDVCALRGQHRPCERQAALGRHSQGKVGVRMCHRGHGLHGGAGSRLPPQLQGLAVGNSAHLPHQALNPRQLRPGERALISGGHPRPGTERLDGDIRELTCAYMIGLVPVSDSVAIIQRIIIRCHRGRLIVCMFSPPALRVLHPTSDHLSDLDGQQPLVASWARVRAVAVGACGV